MKKCSICKEVQPLDAFHKDASKKDGHGYRCKECDKGYKRQYNKEYCVTEGYREARRKRYWENRDEILAKDRLRKNRNLEYYNALARKSYRKNIQQVLVTQSSQRAKRFGYEHNITKEDISIPATCPILGIPIFISDKTSSGNSPSVDRVDNNKGYVKGNIRVISHRANTLKSDASIAELENIIKYLKNEI